MKEIEQNIVSGNLYANTFVNILHGNLFSTNHKSFGEARAYIARFNKERPGYKITNIDVETLKIEEFLKKNEI